MNRIHSFKRLSDNAIFTSRNATSPMYDDRRAGNNHDALHFYQCLAAVNIIIESVSNTQGVYRLEERVAGGTVDSVCFNQSGELIVIVRINAIDLVDINLQDVRPYVPPVLAPTPIVVATPAASYAGDTIRIIQNAIIRNNVRPIRIGDNNDFTSGVRIAKIRRESVVEFLEKFFINWNLTRDTVYNDDSSIQTHKAKRRSIGDIYAICRWYYPTCTLKEVANALYNELPDVIGAGFRSSYCTTIHKRVWYYIAGEEALMANEDRDDETGHNVNWWMDQLN